MSDADRRVTLRKPLPIGVYLVAGGVRHPGTLRDLSTTGAGFSDPVLAVRLHLTVGQRVTLEIPPPEGTPADGTDAGGALSLPAQVAHVSGGLRPRLGLRFEPLEPAIHDRLLDRLGRRIAGPGNAAAGSGGAVDRVSGRASSRDVRFVLVESGGGEDTGSGAQVTVILLGIGAIVVLLVVLLVLGWLTG